MNDLLLHSLLRRQLKRHFGPGFVVPPEWRGFVTAVDEAYREADQDRGMLERSLDLSSQELLQAGAHNRALLQGIPDLLLRLDEDGRILEKQAGAGARAEAGLVAFFGEHVAELPGPVASQYREALTQVARERTMASLVHAIAGPAGELHVEARLVPLGVGECLAIVRNVTESRRAEQGLRQAVSVLQSTLEATADGILVVDTAGRITSYNRRFAEMWRIPREVVEARDDSAVLAAGTTQMKDPEAFAAKVRELYANPEAESVDLIEFRDGRVFERVSRPQRLDGVPVGRVWSFHDLTQRRRAEEGLLKLSSVVEQTADSVLITDAAGNIEYINPAFTALTGYEPADVLGRNPRLLKSGEHDHDFYQELWDTITAGQIFHAVLVNRKKDGELYHADTTITPIKDAAGRITHFVSTEQDITSHRELEAQLRQAQKMEAFGQMAAGVAHDFNNLLTVIIGNTAMLQLDDLAPGARTEALTEIEQAAERAGNLTQQLLTFGRRRVMRPCDIDLNDVLASVSKMLRRLIGEDIALEARHAPGGAFVNADPAMVEQVLVNLALNARDAMPGGGRLALETSRVDYDAVPRHASPQARPGKFACLTVTDTGTGIAPENLAHIFEPFYTTKDVGKGSGLGLAAALSIVEQHHGWMEVESAVGRGATFRIFLPRLAQLADPAAAHERLRQGPRGDETVLLVEDEEPVRRLMEQLLVRHGYTVLAAGTAAEATAVWGGQADGIQLLVTDVILPGGLNGAQLARQLLHERPTLKVLYCSGYSDEMLRENSPLRRGANFVGKPFVPEKFLQQVRACLDARG